MNPKRYFGLGLIVLAVVGAAVFDWMGTSQQPHSYTVHFDRGTTIAAGAQTQVGQIAAQMAERNDYMATIIGHTGTRGDAAANQTLGKQRARTVAQALSGQGIDKSRLKTFSAGGSQPLEKQPDEGARGYQSRLARADIRLEP